MYIKHRISTQELEEREKEVSELEAVEHILDAF